ncbi:DinB family protein [Zunongwangia sp. F363]|uniref:DinB family protein n=1 Tax=Autumnicola tepida TaxID=3075595 RepID=A0ABU3CA13_9FLAO|nr:DinB family protein [Zunongwangia sp. F363]MDT0643188.1 DinB family protein [Zunongwangia sp. F363]
MNKDFFEQNYKANEIYISTLSRLNSSKTNSIFGHVLQAHQIWNERINGIFPKKIDPWKNIEPGDWEVINEKNFQISLEIINGKDMQTRINYSNSKGEMFENTVEEILFHILNHSAYHRGQLALLIRALEKEPPYTDYIGFKRTPK